MGTGGAGWGRWGDSRQGGSSLVVPPSLAPREVSLRGAAAAGPLREAPQAAAPRGETAGRHPQEEEK